MALRLGKASTNPFPAVRLDGARLTLRPPQADDATAWIAVRAQSRAHLVPWEPAWPPDALSRNSFIERMRRQAQDWRAGTSYAFLGFGRDSGGLLCGISLSQVRRGAIQAGTLGYWVAAPSTGQGVATEAVALVCRFAFEELGLHRVEAACMPDNTASRRVLAKNRFAEEGFARRYLHIDGDWRDHVLFGLLRDDWRGFAPQPST